MVVFYSMFNLAGINSQVICLGNENEVPPHRMYLRYLGKELIKDQLIKRSLLPRLPRSISYRLREFFPQNEEPRNTTSSSTKTRNLLDEKNF